MRFMRVFPRCGDHRVLGLAAFVVWWCVSAIVGVPAASAGYSLGWFSTCMGGSMSSSVGYTLNATAGQPAAGSLNGPSFLLLTGFWAAASGTYLVDVPDGGDGGEPLGPPVVLRLHAVSPNPISDHALLRFDLPVEGHVRLRVYDIAGRVQSSLVDEVLPAGQHERRWNLASDERGVAPGIYFLVLEAQSARLRQRVVVVSR